MPGNPLNDSIGPPPGSRPAPGVAAVDIGPSGVASKRTYFGTDGIRGQANHHPITAEVALRVGLAAGKLFSSRDERRHLVVIGKDTRLSSYMIEPALVAGFTSAGMDVRLFGPLPTPGVAMMTRSLRANLGVMISASHNGFSDNGIKLFGPDGLKLSDERESDIEALMDLGLQEGLAAPRALGRVQRIDDCQARYVEIAKATFPRGLSLSGIRVALDCANGAAYKVAPAALYELGAEVIQAGVSPNGLNINTECGSTHPAALQKLVREYRADIGIALDGDGARVVICDERAQVINGDQILALIADVWARRGRLTGGGIVATVMSNLGLERFMAARGLKLERTDVGDRCVMQRMVDGDFNLGGEQSGHIILRDYATTGDGLLAALQVLAVLNETNRPMSALSRQFEPAPQILESVHYDGGRPLESEKVKAIIAEAHERLNGLGRIVVRASGTESLIRIMAEGDEATVVGEVVREISSAVKQVTAAPNPPRISDDPS